MTPQDLKEILDKLEALTDEQRTAFLHDLSTQFCPECGRWYSETDKQVGYRCQCWNDE